MSLEKVKFIADISSNHCNNLQTAKDLIYSAKESGADYAKFQYWETDNFINKQAFENLKLGHQSKWNKSVYDVYKEYQLNEDWIPILYDECTKVGIEFMLSNYELSKIDDFDKYIKTYKIGSGDIDYIPMLEKVISKDKSIFLGCGASDKYEIYNTASLIRNTKGFVRYLTLFQCNTNYSGCDEENLKYLNLESINQLLYLSPNVLKMEGLSDHTKSDIPIIAGIALGVRYIERHFKLTDNNSPDNDFSLNPPEWKHMVKIANQTLDALGDGEKRIMDNEIITRGIQRRSKLDWLRPDSEYLKGLNR